MLTVDDESASNVSQKTATPHTRTRTRWIVGGVIVACVAGLGVAELTNGAVTQAIDATGITCGGDWKRLSADDIAEKRLISWSDPKAAEQGFDLAEFEDLPDGLAEPTLTTPNGTAEDEYDPSLYPLGDGALLQVDGYFGHTWVGADARTGDPLWGFEGDSGFTSVQGLFGFVSARVDARNDLSMFDPRTGEKLSCVKLYGEVVKLTDLGEDRVLAILRSNNDYFLTSVEPATGKILWRQDLEESMQWAYTDGETVVLSRFAAGLVASSWFGGSQGESIVTGIDPKTGEETWRRASGEAQSAVLGLVPLTDGSVGTLVLDVANEAEWSDRHGEYAMLDETGEELWRTSASLEGMDDATKVWNAGPAAIVLDNHRPTAFDIETGEQLWAEGSGLAGDVTVLPTKNGAAVLVTNQKDDAGFFTLLIDPATGEWQPYDAALRGVEAADGYLLASTGMTRIVIPFAE